MSDPALRQRNRQGLLKGEQIQALAWDLRLGKRGRINQAGMIEQRYTCRQPSADHGLHHLLAGQGDRESYRYIHAKQ